MYQKYYCSICRQYLFHSGQILSKSFQGRLGRVYLVDPTIPYYSSNISSSVTINHEEKENEKRKNEGVYEPIIKSKLFEEDEEYFIDEIKQSIMEEESVQNNIADTDNIDPDDDIKQNEFKSSKEKIDELQILINPTQINMMKEYKNIHNESFQDPPSKLIKSKFDPLSKRVKNGPIEAKLFLTGLHHVSTTYCSKCESSIGWQYQMTFDSRQQYKEGKYAIEDSSLYIRYID